MSNLTVGKFVSFQFDGGVASAVKDASVGNHMGGSI
jgi:hypothetical protein